MTTALTLILTAAVAIAVSHVCAKKALGPDGPFYLFLLVRCSAGVLLTGALAVWHVSVHGWPSLPPGTWLIASTSGILIPVLPCVLYFNGLRMGPLSVVAPLGQSTPLFAGILAVLFLGEHMGGVRWTSVALVVGGAAAVSQKRSDSAGKRSGEPYVEHVPLLALVLALSTSLANAFALVVNKRLVQDVPPEILLFQQNLTAFVAFALMTVMEQSTRRRRGRKRALDSSIISWTLLSGVLAFGAANFLVLCALDRIDASLVAPLISLNMLFATGMATLWLKEKPSLLQCLGGCLIAAGCMVLALE